MLQNQARFYMKGKNKKSKQLCQQFLYLCAVFPARMPVKLKRIYFLENDFIIERLETDVDDLDPLLALIIVLLAVIHNPCSFQLFSPSAIIPSNLALCILLPVTIKPFSRRKSVYSGKSCGSA